MAFSLQETRLEFDGKGSEYFRIWITSLFFSILTFGIYSAWAKVKKTRWFYQHTRLLDSHFDYHAKPLWVLLYRTIAIAIIAIVLTLIYFLPNKAINSAHYLLATIIYVPAIAKVWYFHVSNIRWRGIAFSTQATHARKIRIAYSFLLISPALLWFYWPTAYANLKVSQYEAIHYGNASFSSIGTPRLPRKLYVLYLVISIAFDIFYFSFFADYHILFSYFIWHLFICLAFFRPYIQKIVCSHLHYGKLSFRSEIEFLPLLKLQLTNLALIVLSCGLYWPFAVIKLTRYRLQNLVLISDQPLSEILPPPSPQMQTTQK